MRASLLSRLLGYRGELTTARIAQDIAFFPKDWSAQRVTGRASMRRPIHTMIGTDGSAAVWILWPPNDKD